MKLYLSCEQVHPPIYNLVCNAHPSWGELISEIIEQVCEELALPFAIGKLTLNMYNKKDDNRYGYISYKGRKKLCYDIHINMAYSNTHKEIVETIHHEMSHLFEHYLHEKFSHAENFDEMMAYIKQTKGGINA